MVYKEINTMFNLRLLQLLNLMRQYEFIKIGDHNNK